MAIAAITAGRCDIDVEWATVDAWGVIWLEELGEAALPDGIWDLAEEEAANLDDLGDVRAEEGALETEVGSAMTKL